MPANHSGTPSNKVPVISLYSQPVLSIFSRLSTAWGQKSWLSCSSLYSQRPALCPAQSEYLPNECEGTLLQSRIWVPLTRGEFMLLRASREWLMESTLYAWPYAKGWGCQDKKIIVLVLQELQAYWERYKQGCSGTGLYQLWAHYAHSFPAPSSVIPAGSLRSATVGVLILQSSVNATYQSSPPSSGDLVFKHLPAHHCTYLNI